MGALEKKLYILHGWSTDTSKWTPFLNELKKENITPIFLLIPGLTAPLDKPWTLDDYVEWLYGKVHGNIKVSLLGHSNGGKIALAFANKYPGEVAQIFLVDSAGIYRNDFATNVKRRILKKVAKMGRKVTNSDYARNILYKVVRETDYREATPIQKETMKNLIGINLVPKLGIIKTPTVIIWGKNDRVTPYTDALIFKNGLPNSLLFTIKKAKHSPQFTHFLEVVKIIKEHII